MNVKVASILAKCHFPPAGSHVTCAVSGGADSLALLALAIESGCNATAVHVDHGLREGSGSEANVVEKIATSLGAKFESKEVKVAAGPNVEARARAARYSVFPPGVLTGHTADDQAETVLLNLMRGAGLDGLGGIREDNNAKHPIIGLRKHETVEVCHELGLEFIVDSSNEDAKFRRNRVRHELIPLMNLIAERDVVSVIARQSQLLHDDADLLDQLASEIDPTNAPMLASAPLPLVRRALRKWLSGSLVDSVGETHPPDSASIERVIAVARNQALGTDIAAGVSVRRSGQRLSITTAHASSPSSA